MLARVAIFKPTVPAWLPAPLAHAAVAIEGLDAVMGLGWSDRLGGCPSE